ncbi:GAP family protein [Mycolicibacterium parafortuitum]|uniref:GAP family protein n=1 Tax=Mycolicibacterium parafortuitum TaxID=39692 RepID=A0A375YM38_MYCPF|nr:GAP family protein [Mycolicibacterium parafortuitum]ORB30050.1 hypothetical protein BST38_13070 [Mycolicibacterium parafortuitum]SRX82044.1 hypothetical protein MPP7335_03802 [Mycolicibacterium parafortuitum]
MTAQLPTLLAQLVPLAAVVAWSPVKILPPLALVFAAARPRATSLAYLAGSLAALVAATALFTGAPDLLGGFQWSASGNGAWVRIGIGIVLILLAAFAWTRRGQVVPAGAWLTGLTRITPTIAALLAVSLTVLNPKVMLATAAAGLVIGSAAMGTGATAVAVTGFTVLAGSTVIVPVVGYVMAAERVDAALTVLRDKVSRHQAAVAAAVLAVLGAALVATGAVGV